MLDRNTLYAINDGAYQGEFWLPISDEDTYWRFFVMPDFNARDVAYADIHKGLALKIIVPLEKLEKPVVKLCRKQYFDIISKVGVDKR